MIPKRLQVFPLLVGLLSIPLLGSANGPRSVLSLEQRVSAQKAIEAVYWGHRVWPKENHAGKPPLSAVLSDSELRARVEDTLKKSYALDKYWHRPITAAQLQAELDRMAATTRSPEVLREIFASLGNDPQLIAETLARQKLAERLIRNWFANDDRFHGELGKKAAAAVTACGSAACMASMGGEYRENTWSFRDAMEEGDGASRRDVVPLGVEERTQFLQRLAERVGGDVQSLTIIKPGRLEETPDAFVVTAVLSQDADEVRTATVTWPKLSFDEWWLTERGTLRGESQESRGVFTLPSVGASACAADAWPPIAADPLPLPRRLHTAVWTGTEMIIWGGIGGVSFNTGGRYDPSTDSWTPTSQGLNVPAARHFHTAVWTGQEMIVWGGIDGSADNTGGRYNPSTDTWTPVSTGTNVPSGRYLHTAVWTGTEMIVWGGVNGGFAIGGGRYNPLTNTWAPVSTGTSAPLPRYGHSAVWTGQAMIVWGGDTGQPSNTGGRYNPSTDTWLPTSTGPNVPGFRADHTAVWTGQAMIVWGGRYGSFLNTGGRYDPATDTWLPTATGAGLPGGRDLHAAVWTGAEMIVWGGRTIDPTGSFYVFLNTGGRYNPATNAWTPTSTGPNVPEGRYQHAGVWTGSEMLVWGGDNSLVGNLSSGGRYNPATDTWAPTSKGVNAPSPRQYHSSVWTGAEMIVWGGSGGYDGSGHNFNSGGRYDPATDSWTTTSLGANVPQKRGYHTGVWTGTEMIVWGGSDVDSYGYTVYLNTGGRYDPARDIWTPTSTGPGVPAARRQQSAIWTGTQMIVSGGSGNFVTLNTGGRYDPATDTWTSTSIVNAPSVRYSHTAIWTGSTMIVWGGGDSLTNTGGRYDPATDMWTPTSISNAPPGRISHTAIWTGNTMIVWGGSPSTNTGGRYDPVTDTWTPTSIGANVPSPRVYHTAVWTGSDMIVWGGSTNDNIGGRYDPATDTWTPTSTGANVPPPRFGHSAVWTGTAMIVWGGYDGTNTLNTGGLYCACPSGTLYYADADGDGYGNPAIASASCDGTIPPAHTVNRTDCNDANPSVHPGALELCNGVDDDCDRIVDDVSAPGAVASAAMTGGQSIQWPPLAAAQSYDVVYGDLRTLRTNTGHFTAATQGCLADDTVTTSVVVGLVPSPGEGVWILVRGKNCGGVGTYDGEAGQVGPRDAAITASPQACP